MSADSRPCTAAILAEAPWLDILFGAPERCDLVLSGGEFELRPALPDGLWAANCDIAHIAGIEDSEILRLCVETAWRNYRPILISQRMPDPGVMPKDVYQDMLDKIDFLVFESVQARTRLLEAGLKVPRNICLHGTISPAESIRALLRNPALNGIYATFLEEAHLLHSRTPVLEDSPVIYVDVTAATRVKGMSGVIRTELEFAWQLYLKYGDKIQFVAYDAGNARYCAVQSWQFAEHVRQVHIGRYFDFHGLTPAALKPGSTLLIFTVEWASSDYRYTDYLSELAFGLGINIGHCFYDLYRHKAPFWKYSFSIPDTGSLLALSQVASCFFPISRSTARDLRQFIWNGGRSVPPLAITRIGDNIIPVDMPKAEPPKNIRKKLGGARYILNVNTFFYLKNHILLYNLYSRLLKEHDPATVPHLVCVGTRLPNVAAEMMDNDPVVSQHIHHCSFISDSELAALYRDCLFTVYPSLYEGWGLPIGESLTAGKVCLASDTSAMPEIAPELTDLLDPLDFQAWYRRLEFYIFNEENLRNREAEIASYRPFVWSQSGEALARILSRTYAARKGAPILSLNEQVELGKTGILVPWLGMMGMGCHRAGKGGISLMGEEAFLQFRISALNPPCEIVITLQNQKKDSLARVGIAINGIPFVQRHLPAGEHEIRLSPPGAGKAKGTFFDVRLAFVNLDSPFFPWGCDSLVLKSISLQPVEKIDQNAILLFEALDALIENGASLLRGVMAERSDILQTHGNPQALALSLLLWAWQHGVNEDLRLAARQDQLLAGLKRLHALPGPCALLPEYTGLLHAIMVTRKDLAGFAPQNSESQRNLVQWFRENGLREYRLKLADDGALRDSASGQLQITRKRLGSVHEWALQGHNGGRTNLTRDEVRNVFGYACRDAAPGGPPSLSAPTSQSPTYAQFVDPVYGLRCAELGEKTRIHRKQWEFVYILQGLVHFGALRPGARGIGFGCGREPLPAAFAKRGCHVTASDYPDPTRWKQNGQQSLNLRDLWKRDIIGWDEFQQNVEFVPMDMNHIPEDYHGLYDFTWSACALEHLGSLDHGLQFIRNSLNCLKPGGIAIHTTELNISDLEETYETPGLSFYRRKDIASLLDDPGFEVMPINWNTGEDEEDARIDFYPYSEPNHIKLSAAGFVITTIGVIIRKKQAGFHE